MQFSKAITTLVHYCELIKNKDQLRLNVLHQQILRSDTGAR